MPSRIVRLFFVRIVYEYWVHPYEKYICFQSVIWYSLETSICDLFYLIDFYLMEKISFFARLTKMRANFWLINHQPISAPSRLVRTLKKIVSLIVHGGANWGSIVCSLKKGMIKIDPTYLFMVNYWTNSKPVLTPERPSTWLKLVFLNLRSGKIRRPVLSLNIL